MPFVVVLIISLIREAIEDIRKLNYDKEANNSQTITYKSPQFTETKWMDMEVGSIIKVSKDEILPSDILIIKSTLDNGFCYLETTNLDGESALKPREALNHTQELIKNDSDIDIVFQNKDNNTYIEVDQPSQDIYTVEGTAFFNGKKVYFDIKNILLRGGRLKNVDYVYGIVIYTGKDTKLMKNINKSSLKYSHIDKKLDYIVVYILIFCLLLCVICTIVGGAFRSKRFPKPEDNDYKAEYIFYYDYKKGEKNNTLEIIRIFAANFITLNTLIPISIIIVMAVVKVVQALVMEFGEYQLRKDPGDNVKCLSTTLQEEMGMVRYIFSDKTGTLTQNEMEFKACSIFNALFENEKEKEFIKNPNESLGGNSVKKSKFSNTFNKMWIVNLLKQQNVPLNIKNINGCPFSSQNEAIDELCLNITLNHNVLMEIDKKTGECTFQGANPDEVTLVSAIYELGYTYISKENNVITIKVKDYTNNKNEGEDVERKYQILQKFDFTSARQRSSIIVKDLQTSRIKLYLKGSDKKVFGSLDEFSMDSVFPGTKGHVDYFARKGLRTLCYSFKQISENDYNDWSKRYEDMKYQCINDKSLYPELENLIGEIEGTATLLGVSALEDKLQDEVTTDIQSFIEAGINFWMITGDKMDTAESIGFSCRLFNPDTEVFKIKDTHDPNEAYERMKEILRDMEEIEKTMNEDNNDKNNKKNNKISDNNYKENSEENEINKLDINDNNNDNINKIHKIDDDEGNIQNININEIMKENPEIIQINSKSEKKTNNNRANTDDDEPNNQSVFSFMLRKHLFDKTNSTFENLSILQSKVKNATKTSYQYMPSKSSSVNTDKKSDVNNIDTLPNKRKEINIHSQVPVSEEKFQEYLDFCKMKIKECRDLKNKGLNIFPGDIAPKKNKVSSSSKKNVIDSMNFGLIIEGSAITTCMTDGVTADIFWKLIQKTRSMICCRSSPIQKSQVVQFIKNHTSDITLAIGDGGNDVNMIKTAHVGIGLFGKEGYQAAYNSDYAVSQFKYLKQLLFVQGKFCLERNSYFIYHYFFKNVVFTFPQFWLCIFSGFSGSNNYDDWFYMGFNSFCTLGLIAARAVTEEDIDPEFKSFKESERKVLHYLLPDMFKQYRDTTPFNILKFFLIFGVALIYSVVIYFIPVFGFSYNIKNDSGITYSYWDSSFACFLSVLVIHFYIMFIDTLFYNWLIFFLYSLQLVVDILFFIIYEACNYQDALSGYMLDIFDCFQFWLMFALSAGICLIPFYVFRRAQYYFGGHIVDMIKLGKYSHYYIEKFYNKKIEQMTKTTRSIAKFKRILKESKNSPNDNEPDNLADQQMKKIVDEFNEKRKNKRKNY